MILRWRELKNSTEAEDPDIGHATESVPVKKYSLLSILFTIRVFRLRILQKVTSFYEQQSLHIKIKTHLHLLTTYLVQLNFMQELFF